MTKIARFFILALFLATLGFTVSNVSSANAQGTTPYDSGFALGGAIGVRDGSQQGIDADVGGLPFNPLAIQPPLGQACTIYQDFYEITSCIGSTQYTSFADGYNQAYQSGYYYGYLAGYYLGADSLGSLCC